MSGVKCQYKPLDDTTVPADVAAKQDEDSKKGCTRCVRSLCATKIGLRMQFIE